MSGLDKDEYGRLAEFYRARVAEHDAAQPGYAAAWENLTAKILRHGGRLVVPPPSPEVHVELLSSRLCRWSGGGARLVEGEPNRCHANSSDLWLTEQAAQIATGYALSDDGLWRQHTWALDETGTVMETTVLRDTYAGAVLSDTEAIVFCAANTSEETFTESLLARGRTAAVAVGMLDDAGLLAPADDSEPQPPAADFGEGDHQTMR